MSLEDVVNTVSAFAVGAAFAGGGVYLSELASRHWNLYEEIWRYPAEGAFVVISGVFGLALGNRTTDIVKFAGKSVKGFYEKYKDKWVEYTYRKRK